MSVWKPYNFDDFTGSEINETEGLRGFTVHAVDSSQTSHTLNLEDHKRIQKDGAVKSSISVF